MQTFLMLTRLTGNAAGSPQQLEELEKKVKAAIGERCPGLEWVANYAVFGAYDYVDVFRAPDADTAAKASTIVRTFGHATTEVWPAMDWSHYKGLVRDLPSGS